MARLDTRPEQVETGQNTGFSVVPLSPCYPAFRILISIPMSEAPKSKRFSGGPVADGSGSASPGGLRVIMEIFGINRGLTLALLLGILLVSLGALYLFVRSAPPDTITITSGPESSIFHTNATKYAALLAKQGVKMKILTSHGSLENLQRLSNPSMRVDVGLVLGGVTNAGMDELVSLGSLSYQPLLVFYRG